MAQRLAVLILGFCALTSLCADVTNAQPVQATTTEHIGFAAGGTIRIKDSFGSLTVDGWDRPDVEVTVVKSLGFDSEPPQQANRHLDAVHIATERRSNSELVISTTRPPSRTFAHPLRKGSGVVLEYHIRVPRNSHLVINHADGYVSVSGMAGDIEATDRRGDIVMMLPDLAGYAIDAHTKAGIVTSDVTTAKRRKLLPAENLSQTGAANSHRLLLRMGFGGITIKELPHEAVAPTPAVTD